MPKRIASCALLTTVAFAQDPAPRVTWSEPVAKIVYSNCTACHRPGEAAPFPLTTYAEAKRKAGMIAKVTQKRTMPPWHAEHGYGTFADERRLTDEQIETLAAWAKNGAPEGDPAKAPALPSFPEGWQLGEPDVVVKMKDAFDVPAAGPDIYRNFVLPLSFDEDKWVSAIEVRPASRQVVHHILFFLDDSGEARRMDGRDGKPGFRGMALRRGEAGGLGGGLVGGNGSSLGGWAVGASPKRLPQDLALPLPKHSDLVLQTHFHPSGKAEREQTTIGLFFAKQKPKRTIVQVQVPPFFGLLAGIDVPAGKPDFTIKDSFTLPADVEAISIGGHAHYICAEMKATATLPGGKQQPLLWIKRWDFGWQDRYAYAQPVPLPQGTRIDVELRYDNSAENPKNPFSPPQRIRWGRESTDEMGSITLAVVAKDERDVGKLRSGTRAQATLAGRGGGAAGLAAPILQQIGQLDLNRDGRLSSDEIPVRMRRLLARFDANGDGDLDEAEIKSAMRGYGIRDEGPASRPGPGDAEKGGER
jgi:hypothetical protein